jgi:hypothetical protein
MRPVRRLIFDVLDWLLWHVPQTRKMTNQQKQERYAWSRALWRERINAPNRYKRGCWKA